MDMDDDDTDKRLGERMVEAEAKMAARERDRDREPTLSERLDQIEALLEQLLRRVG